MKQKISNDEFQQLFDEMVIQFAEKQTPKIWHQMAMEWNETSVFLHWLADNPNTDKATALMLYWMSGPRYFKQFKNREEAGSNTSKFDLIENIESKYLNGFYNKQNFSFDPNTADFSGTVWVEEYLDKTIVREIPVIMFEKLEGEMVEEPEGFIEGMPPELYDLHDELCEKYGF
ncbi:DUF4274 domain-containing protein [Chryseobacterium joostei]|uniref:DUF4274 domain-containing protein n=1 Tax=Chryseobacterium joostei TaxID=112234 RepID=A0A1N7IRV6_9FLAO|nr:DUF4274 domain-containing protein [Chryseobacterium joostei]AZA98276.1 DUF4274 domain-containing protein [Chryseobacterium joostei]SIS39833.1 protein of unknown function [Chryseobacterium joostei]